MTSIKETLGEVDGRKIINRGDKVKVYYFVGNEKKELTGLIISINRTEIEINGTAPKTKIPFEKIVSIEKV